MHHDHSSFAPVALTLALASAGGDLDNGVIVGGSDQPPRTPTAPAFSAFVTGPTAIPANEPTDVTWLWGFVETPNPEPACHADHGVGAVANGAPRSSVARYPGGLANRANPGGALTNH